MGTQACVYLSSLKKFSFLWVGGSGRGEAGVVWDYMSFFKGGRAERRQGVLNREFHGQRGSTYPSIHSFLLSTCHVVSGEATKGILQDLAHGKHSVNIYWINYSNLCIGFTLIIISFWRTSRTFHMTRIIYHLSARSLQRPHRLHKKHIPAQALYSGTETPNFFIFNLFSCCLLPVSICVSTVWPTVWSLLAE